MKYLDEYRDADVAAALARAHRRDGDAALGAHGGLRRPDAHDRALRHRPLLPAERRAGARPGLPGLRDPAGDDRPRPRDRRAARTSSSARSATCCACPARAATCSRCGAAAPTCASSTRRSTPSRIARENPDTRGRLLRHRLRDHRARQRDGGLAARKRRASTNFSMLVSHVLVPPAIAAILQAPGNRVQALPRARATSARSWATREYEALAARYRVPIVDHRLRAGRPARGHPAGRAPARGGPRRGREPVRPRRARARATAPRATLIAEVFEVCDRKWRGVGVDPEARLPAPLRVPRRTTPSAASRSTTIDDRASRRCASAAWSCAA